MQFTLNCCGSCCGLEQRHNRLDTLHGRLQFLHGCCIRNSNASTISKRVSRYKRYLQRSKESHNEWDVKDLLALSHQSGVGLPKMQEKLPRNPPIHRTSNSMHCFITNRFTEVRQKTPVYWCEEGWLIEIAGKKTKFTFAFSRKKRHIVSASEMVPNPSA